MNSEFYENLEFSKEDFANVVVFLLKKKKKKQTDV